MKIITLILAITMLTASNIFAQNKEARKEILKATNVEKLLEISKREAKKYKKNKAKALKLAKEKGWIIRKETDEVTIELQGVDQNGDPIYYMTHNAIAAETVSADEVYFGGNAGLDLDGTGMIAGEWDGGNVRTTHQEFNNTGSPRAIDKDGGGGSSDHSTHVGGTIIAGGVQASAKGMAYNATLHAYDWDNDNSEMSAAAANGLLISNHSYGAPTGWTWNGSSYVWWGNTYISSEEDYEFGFYNSTASLWDSYANNAPYYLIVKSAGNDRGEGPYGDDHPVDGGADGYDCIPGKGVAKNILTVGAVYDVPGGYSGDPGDVSMSSFSSWGPADDGRIKPDICGNGVSVFSSYSGSDSDYSSIQGTSMSAPNVTGSLLLLQEHHYETQDEYMKAATLKALAIHTADECGPDDGPDYMFGWGLLNIEKAANAISNKGISSLIKQESLSNESSYSLTIEATGDEPLVATIVWSDPSGNPPASSLDPTDKMLVNDLDMRIEDGTNTYMPWKLDGQNPSNAATQEDNDVDNVEKVLVENPTAGEYTINITHKGSLDGSSQNFSLIVTGVDGGGTIQFPAPTNLAVSLDDNNNVNLIWDKPEPSEKRGGGETNELLNEGFESSMPVKANKAIEEWNKTDATIDKSETTNPAFTKATLSSYALFRITSETVDTIAIENANDTTFIDEGLADGTYEYIVKAVYTSPVGLSNASNKVSVIIETPPIATIEATPGCTTGSVTVTSNMTEGVNTIYLKDGDGNLIEEEAGFFSSYEFTDLSNGVYTGQVKYAGTLSELSEPVTLTNLEAPTIINQPAPVETSTGNNASFDVTADGDGLTYQWRKDDANLTDNGHISGANTNTLTINSITESDEGMYDVVVSGTCGEQTSEKAQLSITGIDELKAHGISIFPNPSNGTFNIQLNNGKTAFAEVLDISGRLINTSKLEGKSNQIKLQNPDAGIYMIKITLPDDIIQTKLIIE